jgi:hypothetical protein
MDLFTSGTKVPQHWADQTEDNAKVWAEFWPNLMEESLIEKCKGMVNDNSSQIHSGHRTKNTLEGDFFYKLMDSANVHNEALFYNQLNEEYSILKPFVPEYMGIAQKTNSGKGNQDSS